MLEKSFNAIVALALVLVLATGVFYWGPKLETKVFPVLSSVALDYTHPLTIDELLIASGYVTKIRDCKRINIQAHLGDRHDGFTDYVKLKLITMSAQEVGKGLEKWTLLLAVPRHYVDGDNVVQIKATYRCHGLWETTQIVRDSLASELMHSSK